MSSPKYTPLKDHENDYEISISPPYFVPRIGYEEHLDEWFNCYGDEAVLINNELYTIDELVEHQLGK